MRILLVDDHQVVRRGLMQMLAEEFAPIAFGEAGTAAEALEQIRHADWDLVILDINLPGRSGLDVLADLGTRDASPPVLMLSMVPEEEYALRALRKGAMGYLGKQTVAEELIAGVRKILSGGRYITPALAERLAASLAGDQPEEPHRQLSDRELQVLHLIARGHTVKQIAQLLSLSEKTIFTYRDRLRCKLGLERDAELIRYALRYGLVD